MAFEPSYNLLDKDTHNTLVEALKSGGIGYTEADGTVHKISDTYASGGGGSSLPEVTSDDNGDVLTVVEGAWAKAAPSGGTGGLFIVGVTEGETPDDLTLNKTYNEIVSAMGSGKLPIVLWADEENATIMQILEVDVGSVDDNTVYAVLVYTPGPDGMGRMYFSTDSLDGYPVFDPEG